MNKTDLEQIGALIEEKLEPIKNTLDMHTKKLDGISDQLVEVSENATEINFPGLKAGVFSLRIKETLESHSKRITTIEDNLGLTVSTE